MKINMPSPPAPGDLIWRVREGTMVVVKYLNRVSGSVSGEGD